MKEKSLDKLITADHLPTYSNHEYYVEINRIDPRSTILLNHSDNVNDDILKLLCILDTLNAKDIEPTLIIPLMPYARQNKRVGNKSFGLKIFASMINNYQIKEIITFDLHNTESASLLNAKLTNITPDILFGDLIEYQPNDIVIATDQGGKARAKKMANKLGLQAFYPIKHRSQNGISHIIDFDVKRKNIIIVDDIIDGGRTIKSLIKLLRKKEAKSISIVATHILFYENIKELLMSDLINKIYTSTSCNTSHTKIVIASTTQPSYSNDKKDS